MTIPSATVAGARPEISSYGLRNPWRFSFDCETSDLVIADVGQERGGGSGLRRLSWRAARPGLHTLLHHTRAPRSGGPPVHFAIVSHGPFEPMVRIRAAAPALAATTLALPCLAALDTFVLPLLLGGYADRAARSRRQGLPAVAIAVNGMVEALGRAGPGGCSSRT